MIWSFEDARDNLDDLLDQVEREGPQIVQRGEKRYVFSTQQRAQYEMRKKALARKEEERNRIDGKTSGFMEFLISGPSLEGVDLERDKSPMREVDL